MTSREICRGAEGGARQRWMRSEPGGAGVSQPAEPSLAVVLESSSTEHIAPVQSGVVGLAALPKPGVCVLELHRSLEWFVSGGSLKPISFRPLTHHRRWEVREPQALETICPPWVCLLVLIVSLRTPQPPVLPVLPAALLGSSSQTSCVSPCSSKSTAKQHQSWQKLHAGKHRRPCNAAFT